MAVKLQNRLLILLTEKEQREKRRITYTEIAEAAETSVNVISRWVKNDVSRFDASMVIKLCQYFNCDLCDLLYIDSSDGSEAS